MRGCHELVRLLFFFCFTSLDRAETPSPLHLGTRQFFHFYELSVMVVVGTHFTFLLIVV